MSKTKSTKEALSVYLFGREVKSLSVHEKDELKKQYLCFRDWKYSKNKC